MTIRFKTWNKMSVKCTHYVKYTVLIHIVQENVSKSHKNRKEKMRDITTKQRYKKMQCNYI